MQHTEVDHLVVAARDLAQGTQWCEKQLGVTPQPGGRHPLMGTHNRLLIAIDPKAPSPTRARWFGLDDAALQTRLTATGPELVAWVARSGMVDMHRWGLLHSHLQVGNVLKASRETPAGTLSWQIVVADDGRPLRGGAVPTLIQWAGPHPADSLPDQGLQLAQIAVGGLPSKAAEVLRTRHLLRHESAVPSLQAELRLPGGGSLALRAAG